MYIFKLKPSRCALLIICGLHALSVAALFFLKLSLLLKSLIFLFILISGYYFILENFKLFESSVVRLSFYQSHQWVIERRCDEILSVQVCTESIVTRYFILLYMKPITEKGKIRPLLLWFDSLLPGEARRLRQILATY